MTLLFESLLACLLLGFTCGLSGSFLILRRQALAGDMIGHSVLPGICTAFIASQFSLNPLVLLAGAFFGAIAATLLQEYLTRSSKIKPEMALAINLTGFYAIGLGLLTWIQKQPGVQQAHLESYLLGQAATLSRTDLFSILSSAVLCLFLIVIFFKELRVSVFDPLFAKSSGVSAAKFQFLLSSLVAVSVVVSIKAVGLILVSALLIIPASTASLLSKDLSTRLILASILGALSASAGAYISFIKSNIPTGPAIILVSTFCFITAATFYKLKQDQQST
ncbi:metal ABC transporter permease [bacterium]|nr:metal ABC transporter permease [bacterium]